MTAHPPLTVQAEQVLEPGPAPKPRRASPAAVHVQIRTPQGLVEVLEDRENNTFMP